MSLKYIWIRSEHFAKYHTTMASYRTWWGQGASPLPSSTQPLYMICPLPFRCNFKCLTLILMIYFYFNHLNSYSKHPKVIFPIITFFKYSSNSNVTSPNLWLSPLCYSGLWRVSSPERSFNVNSPEKCQISLSNSATQYLLSNLTYSIYIILQWVIL